MKYLKRKWTHYTSNLKTLALSGVKTLAKTISLAALILVGSVSYAEAIATMSNEAGGKIVLTDNACIFNGKRYDGLARIYVYSPTGLTLDGCYGVEDDTVVAFFENNMTRRYLIKDFSLVRKNIKNDSKYL